MPYWDASAVIPIFVNEARSAEIQRLSSSDADPATSWLTRVECWSAFSRLLREGRLVLDDMPCLRALLVEYTAIVYEIEMTPGLRASACNLVQRHVLRTGDALQLAAALVWAEEDTAGRDFICLDARLREAAAREGFRVRPAG